MDFEVVVESSQSHEDRITSGAKKVFLVVGGPLVGFQFGLGRRFELAELAPELLTLTVWMCPLQMTPEPLRVGKDPVAQAAFPIFQF